MLYRATEDIYNLCHKARKYNSFPSSQILINRTKERIFSFLKTFVYIDTKKSDDLMWMLWSLCLPIDMVDAHPAILTGHWLTLVYISLAVWTGDSWDAYTLVASDPVHTGPSVLTGWRLTLIYVCFTSRIWSIDCQVKSDHLH